MLNVLPLIEEPEWFKDITQENIETHNFDIFKVLEDSLYYPSCGTDGLPITNFAGGIRSFIYVDYAVTREILYSKFKYKIIASRRLKPSELTPNGWQPNWEFTDGDPTTYLNPKVRPFCEWIIFQINGYKCSLLFLCADGVATYQALYKNNNLAPKIIALIQTGVIHGNWTNYADPNAILHRTIFQSHSNIPEYVLHGGYYQLLGDKLYFRQPCWPEFNQKIISIPRNSFYDERFNRYFKGKVVLWKLKNKIDTEIINKTTISTYAPKDVSVPKLQIWHNLFSEIIKNEEKELKIPNPLMFQYGSTLNYTTKIFIFKWHLAYADACGIRSSVENFLQKLKIREWEI